MCKGPELLPSGGPWHSTASATTLTSACGQQSSLQARLLRMLPACTAVLEKAAPAQHSGPLGGGLHPRAGCAEAGRSHRDSVAELALKLPAVVGLAPLP